MSSRSDVLRLNINLQVVPPRWLYFLMFTVSGFAGLIYESIWSHYLKLFLGHAAYAPSLSWRRSLSPHRRRASRKLRDPRGPRSPPCRQAS